MWRMFFSGGKGAWKTERSRCREGGHITGGAESERDFHPLRRHSARGHQEDWEDDNIHWTEELEYTIYIL